MKRFGMPSLSAVLALAVVSISHSAFAQQASQDLGQSIAAAVLPLPEQLRAGATVVRLDDSLQPQILRQGTNGMVCIADRTGPKDDRFDVRCYRDSFIPVVYRAFQLGYAVAGAKVGDEIKAGKLQLSNQPTAGYRCFGPASGYDASSNSLSPAVDCWESVHFPYQTAEGLGLPDESVVPRSQTHGMPFVMGSGTYWAHVMIMHPPGQRVAVPATLAAAPKDDAAHQH
jgi:hypothetical protein